MRSDICELWHRFIMYDNLTDAFMLSCIFTIDHTDYRHIQIYMVHTHCMFTYIVCQEMQGKYYFISEAHLSCKGKMFGI